MAPPQVWVISPYPYIGRALSASLQALGVDATPVTAEPSAIRQDATPQEAMRWTWRNGSRAAQPTPCPAEAAGNDQDLEVCVVANTVPRRQWLYYLEPEPAALLLVGFERLAQHIRDRLLQETNGGYALVNPDPPGTTGSRFKARDHHEHGRTGRAASS